MSRPATSDPMPVILRVFDVARDEEIRKFSHKYNNKKSRLKMNKTIYWALNNGHAIELVREQDDQPPG
jgi:hypothetical protein